jgi:hypothetical protein
MSWVGGWLGTTVVEVEPEEPTPGPDPVEVSVTHGDPNYVDHVASALDRLVQQFRRDP